MSRVTSGLWVMWSGLHYLYSSCRWLQTHTWTARSGPEARLLDSPSPPGDGPLRWGLPAAPTPPGGCWALKPRPWCRPGWRCSPTSTHPSPQRSPPSEPTHHPETEVSGKMKINGDDSQFSSRHVVARSSDVWCLSSGEKQVQMAQTFNTRRWLINYCSPYHLHLYIPVLFSRLTD